ncbi:hypothetical protein [Stomatobaculum longum]
MQETGREFPRGGSLFCARGNCTRHRRALTLAIKRARHIALLPYRVD